MSEQLDQNSSVDTGDACDQIAALADGATRASPATILVREAQVVISKKNDANDNNTANMADIGPPLPTEWRAIAPDLIACCAKEPLNDTGNGQRLLKYFGNELLNVREAESARSFGWHYWTGQRWQFEGAAHAAALYAQLTAERIQLEAGYLTATRDEAEAIAAAEETAAACELSKRKKSRKTADKDAERETAVARGAKARAELSKRRKKRIEFGVSSGNDARLRAMLNQAAPHRTIPQSQLDADPYTFNVANGTLRFEDYLVHDSECPDPNIARTRVLWVARLDEHNPADLITKLSPVKYDPTATAPKFLASLERFQPNENVRHWLQKYYGYGITGLNGEQCLLFNGGLGSNWKSTFTEVVFRVIGDYGTLLKFESFAGDWQQSGAQASPDIAQLPHASGARE